MSDVFVSYANEDRSRIEPLVAALQKRGLSVWWDRRILPGKTWRQVIEAALNEAKCVVVVWTVASSVSEWVQTEAEDARERHILVPILLDEVRIPLEFRRIQAARLVGWSGNETEPGFRDLCEAISTVLGGAPTETTLPAAASRAETHPKAIDSHGELRLPNMADASLGASQQDRHHAQSQGGTGTEGAEGRPAPQTRASARWIKPKRVLVGCGALIAGYLAWLGIARLDRSAQKGDTPKKSAPATSNVRRPETPAKQNKEKSGPVATTRVAQVTEVTLFGHSGAVQAVAITPDGRRLVSGSGDRTLKVWDVGTGRAVLTLEDNDTGVNAVAVTPDGHRVVSGASTLNLWSLDTGRQIRDMDGRSGLIFDVAVTPDGRRAISAYTHETLKVWDLETGRAMFTLKGHSKTVAGVAVTPDGKHAVSASWDKTLKVWDLDTGHNLRTLEGHSDALRAVAVTLDGARALSGSQDKTVRVWDLNTGRVLLTLEGHLGSVAGVAVTPDGRQGVSGSEDKTVKVWDLASGRLLRTFEGHSAYVSDVAVTPDGKRAISASGDGTLKVWSLEALD